MLRTIHGLVRLSNQLKASAVRLEAQLAIVILELGNLKKWQVTQRLQCPNGSQEEGSE